ncbi:DNA primase [Roseospira visakhapatnamensis]|uniref:DNA primase n=1 Tax=Roseospira visakhapatnamensis TaxID=390880 RepID=A0A7W6RAK3_9PROT|nr:DNA primase [Roseospira visakhapatnamensis]MBB4264983.1 DNA primase [Roseospira visakhapatnamensis]
MALSPSFMDELKVRVPLATVIGRRVRLIRNGRHYKACCPFHNEKTPSFYVYDDHYHCFGCGAHGDLISFEMATAGLSFMEAVEALAAEAGLEVPKPDPATRAREQRAADLHQVLEAACAFFEQRLRLPDGAEAMAYLERRGLDEGIIRHFRLGYAPAGGVLRAHMTREGLADDETLVEAGLLARPDDGRAPYEVFRGRVLFPITDDRGRVVSFGGRVLGDGQPKYLNGPETPLFNKRRLLYGLAQAREAVRTHGEVIVAEGYMDVIAMAAAGLAQAVAPLGTALTEEQMERLWALAPEPILCFDGDAAGQRAAARALERALPRLGPGRSLRVALLPEGRDPDDLIRAQGVAALRSVVDRALPLVDLCWRLLRARHRMDTPERRAALERDIEATVQTIDDRAVAQQYRGALRDRFWAEIKAGRGGGARRSGGGGRSTPGPAMPLAPPLPSAGLPADQVRESILLAAILNHPGVLDHVAERLGTMAFVDSRLDSLRAEILSTYGHKVGRGDHLDRDVLVDHLKSIGFGAVVDRVLGSRVCMHASFARAHASTDAALAGWEHVYAMHGRAALEQDLRAAEERLASDSSEDALVRVHTIREGRLASLEPGALAESVVTGRSRLTADSGPDRTVDLAGYDNDDGDGAAGR